MSEYEGALLGMGNPLLDIINDVDQAFLDKYQVIGMDDLSLIHPYASSLLLLLLSCEFRCRTDQRDDQGLDYCYRRWLVKF
jgi:hypothetical protein